MRFALPLVAVLALSPLAGCHTEAYYGTAEAFGVQREEILTKRVQETKEHLAEARVAFIAAADRFAQVRSKDTDVAALREALLGVSSRADSAVAIAADDRAALDSAAETLFAHWGKEASAYHDESMRKSTEKRQQKVKDAYAGLKEKLAKAGDAMKAATHAMDDRLLFLKHNPDARGVEGVADKAGDLKDKASAVTDRTDAARAGADKFLEALGPTGK